MLDLLIITGASRGIGASISQKCSTIAKENILISSSGNSEIPNAENIKLDLQDYCNTYNVLKDIVSKKSNIKSIGIVLAAAQLGEYGGLLQTELDDWDKIYKINVLGNLAVIKACGDLIKSGIKTRIVMFSGGGGAYGYPNYGQYSLSKTSTIRMAENLSLELSKINNDISVIALAPGAVSSTDIYKKVLSSGELIKTCVPIEEPTDFVYKFITDQVDAKWLNGRFIHVRDDLSSIDKNNDNLFKLRRIQ